VGCSTVRVDSKLVERESSGQGDAMDLKIVGLESALQAVSVMTIGKGADLDPKSPAGFLTRRRRN